MTLSEIRRALVERDLRLTKSLGQNFLHDGNQLRRIIDAAQLKADEPVLEIGPGLGPLTDLLLASGAKVLAIEKDRRLSAWLHEHFAGVTALELHTADALGWVRDHPGNWSEWKLVANLPYSVASPLLVELALSADCPKSMVVTVQYEVAKRLTSGPGSPDYGLLTLLIQLRYEARDWFKIPAGCFYPTPRVDSACVCLDRRRSELLSPAQRTLFQLVVRRAFSERRKMMFKLLRSQWSDSVLRNAFAKASVPEAARAEAVSLHQFVQLATALDDSHSLQVEAPHQ